MELNGLIGFCTWVLHLHPMLIYVAYIYKSSWFLVYLYMKEMLPQSRNSPEVGFDGLCVRELLNMTKMFYHSQEGE
jgi:hypothetical protein